MKRFTFHTTCVGSTAELIHAMQDRAREVSWRTFRRHCAGLDEIARTLGYSHPKARDGGLHLCKDWAVSFYRSRYDGQPCYYMDHSRIEHIWL